MLVRRQLRRWLGRLSLDSLVAQDVLIAAREVEITASDLGTTIEMRAGAS